MLNLLDLIACCYVDFITFVSWFCSLVWVFSGFVCIVECLVSGLYLYFALGWLCDGAVCVLVLPVFGGYCL